MTQAYRCIETKKRDFNEGEAYGRLDKDKSGDTNVDKRRQENSLSLERERQLSEFARDREFIILSLQNALKSRHHEEAQDIVLQYRHAIDLDADFRQLAQLAKSVGLERDAIDKILLILDATPDNAYAKRLSLYEQLLEIDPSDQDYNMGYRLAQEALGLELTPSKGLEPQKSYIPHAFLVFVLLIVGLMILGFVSFRLASTSDVLGGVEGANVPIEVPADYPGVAAKPQLGGDVEPRVEHPPTDLKLLEPDSQMTK